MKTLTTALLVLLSVLVAQSSIAQQGINAPPDTIFYNGKIITVDAPAGLIEKHKNDRNVLAVARGQVTLEDVFIGLTGRELRE